jgi:tol-pal system protein YbgF
MKKYILGILALAIAATALSGCVSSRNSEMQAQQIRSLQAEVRELREQLQLKHMEMERMVNQTRTNLPELSLEVDRMRSDLQRLNNAVETSGLPANETMTLQEQLAYLAARLDRLETKNKLPPLSPEVVNPTPPAAKTAPSQPSITYQPELPAPAAPPSAFDAGMAAYKRKDFSGAAAKFKEVLRENPESPQAAQAQFYLGESLYEQRKYEEAILEYQKVIKDYTNSDKVSLALLKQAYSFMSIGDKTSAKLLLQKVVREHPDSYAAGVAKQKLTTIQ